jgi:hypothetical protein
MRIGTDNSFLSIESVGWDGSAVWRVEAAVGGADWNFAVIHEQVKAAVTDGALSQMDDFTAHRIRQFDIALLDGGWLRLKQGGSGCVLVRYRVGQVSAGAALEGEIVLKGQSAKEFCRKFRGLLQKP